MMKMPDREWATGRTKPGTEPIGERGESDRRYEYLAIGDREAACFRKLRHAAGSRLTSV